MKIGISRPYADPGHPKPDVDMGLICQFAEQIGFEWACYGHHTVRPLEEPVKPPHFGVPLYQDPLIGAARALAMTERFEVSTAVLIMPMQHPVTVAKQVATIDCYAPGRFALGLGTGGASQLEIELSGGSFERRWDYTMESIQVMKGLWTQDSFTFEGEFFRFPPTLLGPRPATRPHPPVWLGGFSEKVLRRIGEHCEGWMPVYHNDQVAFGAAQNGPANAREARAKMHRFAEEAGRQVDRFEIAAIMTPQSDLDAIWQYRDAGVDKIALTLPEIGSFDEARHALENIARALRLG